MCQSPPVATIACAVFAMVMIYVYTLGKLELPMNDLGLEIQEILEVGYPKAAKNSKFLMC